MTLFLVTLLVFIVAGLLMGVGLLLGGTTAGSWLRQESARCAALRGLPLSLAS